MPKIKTHGKFEGEETYAPHFYEAMMESGQDEDVEIDGMLIAIFSVTAEDVQAFPELKGREQIAFYESDQGFWTEVRVPTQEEIEASYEEGGDDDGLSGIADEGSAGFIEAVQAQLQIGDRQVTFRNRSELGGLSYTTVFVNYINLPSGVGGAGGGAEAENNRQLFEISGFGRETPRSPAPTGKVKIEQHINALGRERNMRGKTGTPAQVAKYLADYLNKIAREVEPKFTHTQMSKR